MTAWSSIWLLVVGDSPPLNSFSRPVAGCLSMQPPAAGTGVAAAGAVGEELHEGKADGITGHWRTSPRG